MNLTLDTSCTDRRAFRTDLPTGTNVDDVAKGLAQATGADRVASVPGVISLRIGRDEVVLVARTGRVQIRVDAEIVRHERRLRAESLFVFLLQAVRAADVNNR
ncbi:MAG: hypothetical protein IPK82_32980 [Polyangiaceae bacterium]|nr:hypothetical protein [Polyangiaceae bacterium]